MRQACGFWYTVASMQTHLGVPWERENLARRSRTGLHTGIVGRVPGCKDYTEPWPSLCLWVQAMYVPAPDAATISLIMKGSLRNCQG